MQYSFIISARLLPALKINDVTLSYNPNTTVFYLDGLDWSEEITDYIPGLGASNNPQIAFSDILVFMQETPENFGPRTQLWIRENLSAIECACAYIDTED